MREFANHFFTYKQEYNDSNLLHEVLSKWVIMISPLAPHLAEELWKILGYKSLVAEQKWPKYEDKFLTENCKAVIKGWTGLKYSYLEELLLVDISKLNPEDELPWSQENAETLMKNASDFDTWLTETVSELENFTKVK